MSNAQTDFGFDDVSTTSQVDDSKKPDVFGNRMTYVNKKGEEIPLSIPFGLKKGRSGFEDIVINILEECDTPEEAVTELNNFLKRIHFKSIWFKGKQSTKRVYTRDDL